MARSLADKSKASFVQKVIICHHLYHRIDLPQIRNIEVFSALIEDEKVSYFLEVIPVPDSLWGNGELKYYLEEGFRPHKVFSGPGIYRSGPRTRQELIKLIEDSPKLQEGISARLAAVVMGSEEIDEMKMKQTFLDKRMLSTIEENVKV